MGLSVMQCCITILPAYMMAVTEEAPAGWQPFAYFMVLRSETRSRCSPPVDHCVDTDSDLCALIKWSLGLHKHLSSVVEDYPFVVVSRLSLAGVALLRGGGGGSGLHGPGGAASIENPPANITCEQNTAHRLSSLAVAPVHVNKRPPDTV